MTTLEQQGALTLREIMPLLIQQDASKKKLLQIFPLTPANEWKLVYERLQVGVGLQGGRGVGGELSPVPKRGIDQMAVDPGMFGDKYVITEDELNKLRDVGDLTKFSTYDKQVNWGTIDMKDRAIHRYCVNIANMLLNGVCRSTNAIGREVDVQVYNIPQYTPSTLFSDLASATPLRYLRDLIPALELGVSANFRDGSMLMSRPTANLILNNSNAADLGGKRLAAGSTFNSIEDVNKILAANDLPTIETVDDGYYPGPVQSGRPSNFTRYFTNGKILLAGKRDDGAPLGEYRLCRAMQNAGGKGGEWYTVEDNTQRAPWNLILNMGHNGGAVPFYPEGFAVINAAVAF